MWQTKSTCPLYQISVIYELAGGEEHVLCQKLTSFGFCFVFLLQYISEHINILYDLIP